MFKDSSKNNFTLSFDSSTSDRKTVDTQLEHEVDFGSDENINSPKYLIAVNQSAVRMGVPNKANNLAIFHDLDVKKYHVYIDGFRYPRDSVNVDYGLIEYVDQYRALKLFYKECVGGELLNPFIKYTDMKNKYRIQLIALRFQVDHLNP